MTNQQENYYLEISVGSTATEYACQVHKLRYTPMGRDKGKAEYPACPPTPGGPEAVVLTKGNVREGSATFELWHDTTPTGITTALMQAQQAGEVLDYTFIWRFDNPEADYQWSGQLTVEPIENTWDKTDDRTHRGPVTVTILSSVLGRPDPQTPAE